jgi:hypothetical protein
MIARLIAVVAFGAVALQPVMAAGVTAATEFGPPNIRLEAADTLHATRQALVRLPAGETLLALPLDDLGVSPSDVTLAVEPGDCVRLVALRTGPDGARWLLRSAREVEARVSLTYPIEGLSWAIEYAATLGADGSLDLGASLRVTNGLKRDLEDARFVGEFARARLSLEAGQSITVEQPWLSANISPGDLDRSLVYDKARHGDSPVELLTVSGDATARATGLPAGSVRIYASPEAGGEFITGQSLPYVPPHEPIELALGPASGVQVSRSLDQSKEVDRRLDARNKVALFDLQETWVLEARNLREEPVDLLIREQHEGAWKLEECDADCERVDAETLVFDLTLAPEETREITFRIRHQNRQP